MPSIVINGVNYSGSSAKGTVVNVPASKWTLNNSSYQNTIPVQGISANSNLNASLYDSENEELCRIFSELITGAEAGDNQIILIASELITVDFKLLVYGEINFDVEEEEIPLTAANIVYDNSASGLNATSAQGAIDEIVENLNNFKEEGSMTSTDRLMLKEIYKVVTKDIDTENLQYNPIIRGVKGVITSNTTATIDISHLYYNYKNITIDNIFVEIMAL